MISIDPGVHYCGVAWWRGDALIAAELRPSKGSPPSADKAVCEVPQIYTRGAARSADLVDLALAAGRMAALCREVTYVRPAQWKGQLPKHVVFARMDAVLSADEKKILSALACPVHLLHNVFDAVALGLVNLGRLRMQGSHNR